MLIAKPLTLGLLSRVAYLRHRHVLVIGATAAFRLDDPTRLLLEPVFWKAAAPALGGAILDEAMPKPQGEVLLAGHARAPGGRPVQAMDVAFRVGAVSRRLRVIGDRVWRDGASGLQAGPPTPFLEMAVSAARAFGGPDFAENTAGRGHGASALLRLGQPAPLANIEDPSRPMLGIEDTPPPVLAGPVALNAPSRQRLAGTYGPNWLRDHHPGLPPDADMRIFQSAQPAQWATGFFSGEEEIVLAGFHADAQARHSRLPGMRVRAFARQREGEASIDREVALRIDTVWLFPDLGIGCAIHRGLLPVADAQAKDVSALLLGYERMADPPRPMAHYQEQMQFRVDPVTRPLYVLRDGPLKPQPSAEERAARQAARARKREAMLAQMRLTAAINQRETERQMGLPPGILPPPPEPELPDFPIITQEDIDEMDIDLGEIWEAADRQFAKLEAMAAEPAAQPDGLDHLLAAAEGRPAPPGEPPAEMAEAVEAMRGARDPAWLLGKLPADTDAETRARAEAAIAAALAPPPPEPEEEWRKIEDRLLGDVSNHPMMRSLAGLVLPDVENIGPPDDGSPASQAAREAMARQRAEPPAPPPDLDALLAGIELPAGAPADAPKPDAALAEARDKLSRSLGEAFPGLAGLPPGEALRRLIDPMTPAPGPPPTNAQLQAMMEEARASAEQAARGEGLVEPRRLSPEPIIEEAAWQEGFGERLTALIATMRASPQGLAGRDFQGVRMPGLALPGAALEGSFWERAGLPGADFRGAALRHGVFTAADLSDADMAEADLRDANFSRAKLHRTGLAGANLEGASWFETEAAAADFSRARMIGPMALKCRFGGARFIGAEITDAMFLEADMAGVDFSGARLTRCIFMRCDLTAAKLRGAVLDTCAFLECPMPGADLTAASLTNTAFLLGKLAGARFRRVTGQNVTLLNAALDGADFAGAVLPGSTLMGASLVGADMRGARLRRCAMSETDLSHADLAGADLFEAQLRGAKFGGANLFGANLYSADLEGAELALADLSGANLRNTVMERESDVA